MISVNRDDLVIAGLRNVIDHNVFVPSSATFCDILIDNNGIHDNISYDIPFNELIEQCDCINLNLTDELIYEIA